ncbi:MAG TPA: outer membrane beta-barrel family protein, partial [Saprospiraceae bacterium]|nr:outer membrane beta-barrel family protein [Saprospiraceae bacterium]
AQVFAFYRRILLNGDHVETDTHSDRDPDRNDHNARLGLDYQITPKTVFGTLLSAYNTKWTMDAHNTSTISTNEVLDTNIQVLNTELNQWKHIGGNLYLQHAFCDGHTITLNADALWYRDNNPTSYHNMYFDPAFNPIYDNFTRATKITPIRIKVASLDYVRGLGKKIKSESGLKISHSHFTNDVGVDYLEAGTWLPDPDLTANYDLTEDIFAAYASLETPLGKGFTLKAGLRYEYTSSNLGSAEVTDIVDRKFGEWFPSVFLSKDFSENYALNLSYSKRITRPTFNDMAPFVIFIDPSTFFSGNPALQPAIANKIGLGCKLKTVVFNVEYAREDSTIARFQSMVLPGTNKQLLFAENFRYTDTWSATLSIPVSPFKWWNMYYNLNGSYQKASRFSEGVISDYSAGGLSGFSSQTFTLSKSLTLELTGFYSAGGLFGIVKVNSFGALNAGLQLKFGAQGN